MNAQLQMVRSAWVSVCAALALTLCVVARAADPPAARNSATPASPAPAPAADPAIAVADGVLKAKGLTKAGSYYLLPDDASLASSLRQIQRSENQLKAYVERRRGIERDIAKANKAIRQWWAEDEAISKEMAGVRGNVERYNQLGSESNTRQAKIRDAEQYIAKREGDLRKLAAPDAHIAEAASLADRLEAAIKRYGELAADAEVGKALARLNAGSKILLRLGPSPQLKAELPRLAKMREQAKLSAVPVAVHRNSAMVSVTINGTTTVPMVVDTGAMSVILTAEIAGQLNLPARPDDYETVFQFADGGTRKGRVTKVASMRVGPYTVRDVECGILPAGTADECLLGASFLRHFIVRVDFAGAKVHLTPLVEATAVAAGASPATQPGPTKPPAAVPSEVLTIEATVDGGDVIVVTAAGLKWEHESWGWPTDVRVNGEPWEPRAQASLPYKGPLAFLSRADLESGRVIARSGRGDVTTADSPEGLRIRFGDAENGAARYSIRVAFPPKAGARGSAGPTSKPATGQPAGGD